MHGLTRNSADFSGLADQLCERYRVISAGQRRGGRSEYDGVPVLAYDPAISQPMADDESGVVPPELWPLFESSKATPMLVVRGVESDILSRDCLDRMRSMREQLQVAEIPHRGHAPTLTEPASLLAIDTFMAEL